MFYIFEIYAMEGITSSTTTTTNTTTVYPVSDKSKAKKADKKQPSKYQVISVIYDNEEITTKFPVATSAKSIPNPFLVRSNSSDEDDGGVTFVSTAVRMNTGRLVNICNHWY